MKITDINMCLGMRDSYGKRVTPESLLAEMDLYHIDRAVVYHEYAQSDPLEGNSLCLEAVHAHPDRLAFSAVADPILGALCLPGEGSLKDRLAACGAASLHIFPDNNRTVFHPLYWEEILEAADALSLPLVIDGEYPPELFFVLPEISKEYPNIKFILIRYGLCRSRHLYPLLTKRDNIYAGIENLLDNNHLEELREIGAVSKLLFSSSYPLLSPAGPLGLALYADLPEADRDRILTKNWEEIAP